MTQPAAALPRQPAAPHPPGAAGPHHRTVQTPSLHPATRPGPLHSPRPQPVPPSSLQPRPATPALPQSAESPLDVVADEASALALVGAAAGRSCATGVAEPVRLIWCQAGAVGPVSSVAECVAGAVAGGVQPGDIAVVVRTDSQAVAVREALGERDIHVETPCEWTRSKGVAQLPSPSLLDAIEAVANLGDAQADCAFRWVATFGRVAGGGRAGRVPIGTLLAVEQAASALGLSLYDAALRMSSHERGPELQALLRHIQDCQRRVTRALDAGVDELVRTLAGSPIVDLSTSNGSGHEVRDLSTRLNVHFQLMGSLPAAGHARLRGLREFAMASRAHRELLHAPWTSPPPGAELPGVSVRLIRDAGGARQRRMLVALIQDEGASVSRPASSVACDAATATALEEEQRRCLYVATLGAKVRSMVVGQVDQAVLASPLLTGLELERDRGAFPRGEAGGCARTGH